MLTIVLVEIHNSLHDGLIASVVKMFIFNYIREVALSLLMLYKYHTGTFNNIYLSNFFSSISVDLKIVYLWFIQDCKCTVAFKNVLIWQRPVKLYSEECFYKKWSVAEREVVLTAASIWWHFGNQLISISISRWLVYIGQRLIGKMCCQIIRLSL